jgi:hypothetical protein
MRVKMHGMALLMMVFAIGAVDVALAGGAWGVTSYSQKLTDAEVAECAENPEKLATMTSGRSFDVKADALARVLDKIVENEGIDSPKIDVALESLAIVSFAPLGNSMRNSPNKDQILLKIRHKFGEYNAIIYAENSGAKFPGAPIGLGTGDTGSGNQINPPPTENPPAPTDNQTQQQQQQNEQPATPTPPPVGPVYPGQGLS